MNEIKSLRNFGFIMTAGFAIIGIVVPFYKYQIIYPMLAALSFLFLFLAVFFPYSLKRFREWWTLLGEVLGAINSKILFTIIYMTVFTFIHLMFKLLGRDKMKRKWKAYESTYVIKQKISSFSDPF